MNNIHFYEQNSSGLYVIEIQKRIILISDSVPLLPSHYSSEALANKGLHALYTIAAENSLKYICESVC